MPGSALAHVPTSRLVAQIAPARNREIMALPPYLVGLKVTRTLSSAEDTRAAPFVDGVALYPCNFVELCCSNAAGGCVNVGTSSLPAGMPDRTISSELPSDGDICGDGASTDASPFGLARGTSVLVAKFCTGSNGSQETAAVRHRRSNQPGLAAACSLACSLAHPTGEPTGEPTPSGCRCPTHVHAMGAA